MSTNLLRGTAAPAVGLAMLLGASTWFVVFIGPEWGFLGHGYRPNAILLGAVLLTIGIGGTSALAWSRWSGWRRAGMVLLLGSVALVGAQATAAFSTGVSFEHRASSAEGLGVALLPLAVGLLVFAWGWSHPRRQVLASVPGVATLALAVALLLPAQAGWFDLWEMVFRYTYLLGALAIVSAQGYRLTGGPHVRLERQPLVPA